MVMKNAIKVYKNIILLYTYIFTQIIIISHQTIYEIVQ